MNKLKGTLIGPCRSFPVNGKSVLKMTELNCKKTTEVKKHGANCGATGTVSRHGGNSFITGKNTITFTCTDLICRKLLVNISQAVISFADKLHFPLCGFRVPHPVNHSPEHTETGHKETLFLLLQPVRPSAKVQRPNCRRKPLLFNVLS